MYPRRVFNVFFLLFCTYWKPRCFERTTIDAFISAITCRSAALLLRLQM